MNVELFSKRPRWETSWPVTENVMEVRTHYLGGLKLWQSVVEALVNIVLLVALSAVAFTLNPTFGVIWTIAAGASLMSEKVVNTFRVRIFKPEPASEVIRLVGADVPMELLERFHKVEEEYHGLLDEIRKCRVSGEEL